jgi:hypothetical protein
VEVLEQAGVNLRYPDLRDEVIAHVSHLADPEYQDRVWVRREYPTPDYYDDFSQTFEALEDLGALEDPDRAVGSYLRTTAEAGALAELGECFRRLFDRYGTDISDAEYLRTAEWSEVVRLAGIVRELLVQS